MARGQHRVRRGFVPDPRSRGRHPAGAVRLHERRARHPGHRAHHLPGRPAHQRVRRALRRGHGPAHARRGLWLHRLHHHLADLRLVHLHLLRARSGGDGLRAGAGAGHPARLGLPDLRGGGHPVGHARGLRDQPLSGLDPAAVAGDDGGPFWGGGCHGAGNVHQRGAVWGRNRCGFAV
ncbi:hypothetical protein FQZ97_1029680 [compost metagenome]